ncbi:MAG: hypothetical protein WA445_18305 [Pseudolabrys sp.]|jgi:hypothetical protein
MGYNARNDEIRDNVTRMRREWEAQRPRSKKSCLRLTDNYQMTPTSELIDDLLSERESRMKGEHRG